MEQIPILRSGVLHEYFPPVRALGRPVIGYIARRGNAWLAAGLVMVGVYFFSGFFTPVRFDRERIEIRLEPDRIIVTGLYHYENSLQLPTVLSLRVPFPLDCEHPAPAIYTLSEASADGRVLRQIQDVNDNGKILFRLLFRPGEKKWVRLTYVQPTRVSSGRYILKTTQAWHRVLARGEYVLRLPREMTLNYSNFPVAPIPSAGPWKTYGFSAINFLPDRDWEFSWNEHSANLPLSRKEVVREAQLTRRLPPGMARVVGPAGSVRQ